MAKQSSYQKLKAKIAEQQKQINHLKDIIADDNAVELFIVKKNVLLDREAYKAIWQGESDSKGNGILDLIQPTGVKRIPAKIKKR